MTFKNSKYFDLSAEKIMENRVKWVALLKDITTQKTRGKLDNSEGARCCLGHGCYAIGLPGNVTRDESGRLNKEVDYCGSTATAPEEFISAVGLKNSAGAFGKAIEFDGKKIGTLVGLNDATSWTPQQIGAWLETVIEGGDGSPFVRL